MEENMEYKNKRTVYIMGCILAMTAFLAASYIIRAFNGSKDNDIQESLAEKVIRLHVVANSDDSSDQELKLKVKNVIVDELRKDLSLSDGKEEAEAILRSKLEDMESIAKSILEREGYAYAVSASLGRCWFPIKRYGDMVFPEGDYDALIIDIGKATGKNWWCVMFPSLCFVDETYQVVPEESKEALKKELTYEEYKEICKEGEDKVEYRSGLADWWKSLWD